MPSKYDFGGYRCKPPGEEDTLGDYLQSGDAHRDEAWGFARTHLVYDAANEFVGYYTLRADAIRLTDAETEGVVPYRTAPAVKIDW